MNKDIKLLPILFFGHSELKKYIIKKFKIAHFDFNFRKSSNLSKSPNVTKSSNFLTHSNLT